jgi:hypothetical protein
VELGQEWAAVPGHLFSPEHVPQSGQGVVSQEEIVLLHSLASEAESVRVPVRALGSERDQVRESGQDLRPELVQEQVWRLVLEWE